jgi:hypothetical protein
MINTENSSLPNKNTRAMRHAVMLLFLCRLCRDVMKFCALEKIRELMTAKRSYLAQQSAWERKLV